MKNITLLLLMVGCTMSCTKSDKQETASVDTVAYNREMAAWKTKRVQDLKAPDGWLNLVGLIWLKEGVNTFGSDPANDVLFPSQFPARAGFYFVKQGTVSVEATPASGITFQGKPVKSMVLFHPDSSRAPKLEYDSLRWNVIKRDDKYGIRLRDLASPEVVNFAGIDSYPVSTAWRLKARFEKASGDRTVEITNILGQTTAQKSEGSLVFSIDEKEFRLDVLDGNEKEYFVIFGDPTNANETYGAGRYIYVPKPDATGTTIIDFNKAYNPPCAFTAYATCPLPPKQNVLTVAISAGEKNYGDYAHTKETLNEK